MVSFFLSFSSVSFFDCPVSIKKLQDQNESHQVSRNKMAETMALALEKKDHVSSSLSPHTTIYSSEMRVLSF